LSRGTTPRRFLRVVDASGVLGCGEEASAEGAVVVSAAGTASASFFDVLLDGLVIVVHSLVLDGIVRGGESRRAR
jgi:hypothetical protein